MRSVIARTLAALAAAICFAAQPAVADVLVDFEDLSLPRPNSSWNGSDLSGGFVSGGAEFANRYNATWETWSGFSYSNVVRPDVLDWQNQYASAAGPGAGGSATYAVASGYWDLQPNLGNPVGFDPTNPDHLNGLPRFTLPEGYGIESARVTNTAYTALAMRDGYYGAKKFGGASGTEPDWLKLSVYGTDASGTPLDASVVLYLADFRFENDARDYILTEWAELDLTALSGARNLHFNLSSSDISQDWGMNTPAYFALDDIRLRAVPEPSGLALAAAGLALLAAGARRRARLAATHENRGDDR